MFRAQLAGLSRTANIAAIDLPGHGETPGPSFKTIEAYAAWTADFLERGPVRPVVLGHSMGGAIAQTLALARPDLLRGLILAASGALLKVLPALLDTLRTDYAKACADIVSMAYGPAALPALLRQAKEELLALAPQVTLGDFLACDQFDLRGRLDEIDLPSLVVVGTRDQLTPPQYASYLASKIKNARLELIENAGHGLFLESPTSFNQAVQEFLAGLF